jgi:hypothetical protein
MTAPGEKPTALDTVQQQPQSVVGEVRKPCPTRLTFLTSGFSVSVGPLEQPSGACQARISASHALTVRASRDSSPTWTPRPAVGAVQRGAGCRGADRGVHGPKSFHALPGRGDLTGGIPGRQPGPQPRRPRPVSCSAAVSSSLRMRYSGSGLRPQWPRVACCTRRRTWLTTALASRMAWKWRTRARDPARPWRPGQPVAWPGMEPGIHGGPGAVGHQVQ